MTNISAEQMLAQLQNMQQNQGQPVQASPFSTQAPQATIPTPPQNPFAQGNPFAAQGQQVNPPANPFGHAPNLGEVPQVSSGLAARMEPAAAAPTAPAKEKATKAKSTKAPQAALSPEAEKLLAAYVQSTLETNAKIQGACDAIVYAVTRMYGGGQ